VKKIYSFGFIIVLITLVSIACNFSMPSNANLESTKMALALEQTKLAILQSGANLTSTAMVNQNPSPTLSITPLPPSQTPTMTPVVPTPTSTPTHTPTQEMTYQAMPGFSNLTDYFADPNSGWPEKTSGVHRYWYASDHYHIQVDTINTQYVVLSGFSITNGAVMTYGLIPDQTSSPLAYYGVVCRYQDQDNYYFFEISYDGYYRIGKIWNGVFSLIGMGAAKTSTAINIGDYNEIIATCVENELSLTVNGTFIETVYDNTFTSGNTGLCASASAVPGIIAAFDYFIAEE
jgi:hypothetical protein